MNAKNENRFTQSVPFWAMLTFGTFGAIMILALTEAINAVTTMILMTIPAGLFFRTMRAANNPGPCKNSGEAQRRYVKRVAIFASLYLVVVGIQVSFLSDNDPSRAVRAGLSVLPGFAVLGVFWAIGRLIIEEQDEFIRMLTVRQTLIATGLTLGFATLWGFLEAGEVVPHIDAYWFAVVFFFGQIVGAISNRIQYGAWGAV